MTEFELIYQIFNQQNKGSAVSATQHSAASAATLLQTAVINQAIGDDAAVVTPPEHAQLVTCIDTLVQGRHFAADWDSVQRLAFAIGYKAVAVNLSDLAAMGAVPHSILLALALPHRLATQPWLSEFAKGLFHACDCHGVTLIGGDTTRHEQLVISVTANGWVDTAIGAVYRSGAQVGDKVYVSGTLGDASYALKHSSSNIGQQLAHRLHMPTPRVQLGQLLAQPPHRVTAMIDVSDGLYQDLSHICRASGVSMRLNLETLPSSNIMQAAPMQSHLVHQLTGGDDYELAFTLPADTPLPATDTTITCIGEIIASSAKIHSSPDDDSPDDDSTDRNSQSSSHRPYLYYQGQAVTEDSPFPFDYLPDLTGFQHF